jgi:hypothetical protein
MMRHIVFHNISFLDESSFLHGGIASCSEELDPKLRSLPERERFMVFPVQGLGEKFEIEVP